MKWKIIRILSVGLFLFLSFLFLIPDADAGTYYSYQSGNWHGTNVWTTDSTGTTLIGSVTPGNNDNVYILTGRTIIASANITSSNNAITINLGAVLDLADKTIPAITLNGKGLFRVSRVAGGIAVMPTISGGTFLGSAGGTVEYYASSGNCYLDDNKPNYYNLVINLDTVIRVITVRRNITVYGSMTVTRGTFQINDATTTKRSITINGSVTVSSKGKITTGTGNTNTNGYSIGSNNLPPLGQFHSIFHELFIGGNFTNNGIVRFTNLPAPNYGEFPAAPYAGAVTVWFTGETNNTMTLNGVTDFYNLIINKGTDQTYALTINSSSTANFALYGTNSVGRNQESPFTTDNPEVRKALWIRCGTLKLTGTMLIPSLTEGHIGDEGNGDYAIGSNGQLWIADPGAAVYSTATSATGFPEAPVNSVGVKGLGSDHQAISIYGTLHISDGYLSTRHSAGIIFWETPNSSSVVIIEGGTVNVSVMRTTVTASGKTSYLQTGGTVIVRGNETEPGEMSDFPIFSIPNPFSSFIMTGGKIIIRDNNNGTLPDGNGLFLNCDPENFSVTGGDIIFETNPVNTATVNINSTVTLWNLDIKRLGTTGNPVVNLIHDISVTDSIEVFSNATFSSGTGNYSVSTYGEFKINTGGTYSPNINTTYFLGFANNFLWNFGTITNGLYNLTVDKPNGSLILVSGGSSFNILNNLSILKGTFVDAGKVVYVSGNVINNGTHIGAGRISLVKSNANQTISGNGLGKFQNLELNNTNGSVGSAQVNLLADITITGNLILANDRLFNISTSRVTLNSLAKILGTMSNSRFICTSGAGSDGGLTRIYSDTVAFTFPVGTGTTYTPATIHVRRIPQAYGSISVKPVPVKHPFVSNTSALDYFWKVEESGFVNIRTASVRLFFNYGNLADNAAYVPGKYIPVTWSYINNINLVDEATNTITFPGETTISADYTAGIPAAFGAVVAFYSRDNGPWSSPSTWSNESSGGSSAKTIPGPNNPVFIGDGGAYVHTVTVTTGGALAGSLSILYRSTLELGTTTGNNFGYVLPRSRGKINIKSSGATAIFPAGDFGNFLGPSGGSVEYYSGTVDYTLPTISSSPTSRAINNYCILILSPGTGRSILMPNSDLIIYGNFVVSGASSTGLAKLTALAARTLTLKDDLLVNSGNLLFQNGMAQTVRVDSNVTIASSAIFNIANSGTGVNNTMSIGGSLTNNGVFDMSISATYKCDATFTGETNTTISGSGATTDFYSITVDKGYSQTPRLSVTATNFAFSNNTAPLVLLNGTFRLISPVSITVSQNLFEIPATACLSTNGGTLLTAMAANDDADVRLAGKIEVLSGGITIGNIANNFNNDIEYAGAGTPTIDVQGGALFVNGQIRRNLINGLGSLNYKQSGTGAVTVNARHPLATRAKLEILNMGSIFNMSGGTLTFVRGSSSTYNDCYLRPDSSVVTGGTIIFGNSSTENTNLANMFSLETTVPLYNITVDGTTTSKTVTLGVHGLILKGNLTINATSVFDTDSLDVTIAGNLTNLNTDANTGMYTGGYRPGMLKQTTTFNGTANNQTIGGASGNVTNFANLVFNNTYSSGTITLQANTALRVNGDLTMTKGTVADGGNIITVIGNIANFSTHSGTGRILLAGSIIQIISGNGLGKFGNLYLNSSYDVKMVNITEITGVLTFQTKMLDIGSNLLKLTNTATGAIAGSSATSYIRTDGLISDAGVQKSYPTTAVNFTFPIGVKGKYTPVALNVIANTSGVAGTITVIPVNSKHPCTTDAGDFQLTYYWHVEKTGFNVLTIDHYYTYVDADIKGAENNYRAARFYGGQWITAGGTMSTGNNQIRFLSASFIDGEYTAGYLTEFGAVLTYYSRNATLGGNWNEFTTWSTTGHAGTAATTIPDGQPVIIASGHTVYANNASRRSYTLTLTGTAILDLATSVGHDFGTVSGTGTIKIVASSSSFFVFPAGNFNAFTASGGGTIELTNISGTANFPYLTTYNKLVLKGAGTKQIIDVDITINGTLINESVSKLTASGIAKLILVENWINDGTFSHNNGTIEFNGNTNLSGASTPYLNNLTINTGKTLSAPETNSFIIGVAGNWVNNGTFNQSSGTVAFNGSSIISGSSTTTFNNISISSGKSLTGKLNDNIIILGNWINNGTFINNGGTVTFNGNSIISGSSVTSFGKVIINGTKTLTGPASGEMDVTLDFVNNGTFVNNGCTLGFNGNTQYLSGTAHTLFENISIGINSNTTIFTSGQTLRGVLLCNGLLTTNGNLTLLSTSQRTALIDGSGSGEVLGIVPIQRYLPSGFGYKYFSSPFTAATVSQFGDHMNLNATFPTFYSYDENRPYTGWVKYTTSSNLLVPLQGYAVNFGPSATPITVDIQGIVNNNTLIPATLFNHNFPYTLGFNLMGNPYPSPVDWDASNGWIRLNIDNAIYYFNAGTTDQYTGTYRTYINGISSDGIANSIIPAMQGFFIHVSDGSYPVAATLIFTNGTRVNNLSPVFHKSVQSESRPLIRITSRFCEEESTADPVAIYFTDESTFFFDKEYDALKLMNTDDLVPNFYALSSDDRRLSINGIPQPVDSITKILLGVKTKVKKRISFFAKDMERIPPGMFIYFVDSDKGRYQNLLLHSEYQADVDTGETDNRFSLVFSMKDLRYQPNIDEKYHFYSSLGRLFVYINFDPEEKADLIVHNMLGQEIFRKEVYGNGYHELDLNVSDGMYIVTLSSNSGVSSKKIIVSH